MLSICGIHIVAEQSSCFCKLYISFEQRNMAVKRLICRTSQNLYQLFLGNLEFGPGLSTILYSFAPSRETSPTHTKFPGLVLSFFKLELNILINLKSTWAEPQPPHVQDFFLDFGSKRDEWEGGWQIGSVTWFWMHIASAKGRIFRNVLRGRGDLAYSIASTSN